MLSVSVMANKFNLNRGRTDENKKRRRKVSPYSVHLLKLALSLCNLAQEKEHRSTAFAFLLYGFNRGCEDQAYTGLASLMMSNFVNTRCPVLAMDGVVKTTVCE